MPGTTLHFDEKILRMKRSMNEVPRKLSIASCGPTPNHRWVHQLPTRRRRWISPSNDSISFVAVHIVERILRFMRWVYYLSSIEERIKFTPGSVSRRQPAMYMIMAVVLYVI